MISWGVSIRVFLFVFVLFFYSFERPRAGLGCNVISFKRDTQLAVDTLLQSSSSSSLQALGPAGRMTKRTMESISRALSYSHPLIEAVQENRVFCLLDPLPPPCFPPFTVVIWRVSPKQKREFVLSVDMHSFCHTMVSMWC